MRDISDASRQAARDWLLMVSERSGKSLTALAKLANVATSTITRAVNDPDHPHTISATTISKIASATGIPAPDFVANPNVVRFPGFAAPEAEPYKVEAETDDRQAATIRAMLAGRNAVDAWVLKTRALELAGYLPGDIVAVDLNGQPHDGDVVVAQLYDYDRGRADTIWRLYQKPYLVAASTDRAFVRPHNEAAVQIKGVVIGLFRPRAAA